MALITKIKIEGEIHLITGLHIGGSKGAIEAGALDSPVIKTAEGVPYIPGSSLKGSLRSILERSLNISKETGRDKKSKIVNDIKHPVAVVFGVGATNDSKSTRLVVRDSFLTENSKNDLANKTDKFEKLSEVYTETKHENIIHRETGGTVQGGLREIERVPAGSVFNFEMIYDIYDDADFENLKLVGTGMRLLQDNYLGGSGSRGYGKVEFKNASLKYRTLKMYEENMDAQLLQGVDLMITPNLGSKLKEVIK